MIYFLTYGDDKYKNSKKRIEQEAINSEFFDKILIKSPNDLPINLPELTKKVLNMTRGGGYWIWKPIIIKETLDKMNENDILVYVDSGCTINKKGLLRFNEYIEMLKDKKLNKSMIRFYMDFVQEYKYTNSSILKHFKCDNRKQITDSGQYIATVILIRKCHISQTLINLWYETAINHSLLFTDELNNIDKNIEFVDNRHDQSIFSIITKIFENNIYKIKDETFPYNEIYPILATRIRG